MKPAAFIDALHAGRRVYGTCITSPTPKFPAMAGATGLDFVFIDTEHTAIDRSMLNWMCEAYNAEGLTTIVRTPAPDPYQACMALDGGAAGVVAPYVESVEQVRALVGAVKYRPLKGRVLYDALEGRKPLDAATQAFLAARNAAKVAIINVESVPALERLDEIASVPGLDGFFVGPHDLSINLGVPEDYDHPRFAEAITKIIQTARRHMIGVGIHYSGALDKQIGWAKEGANIMIHGSDISLLNDAIRAMTGTLREACGDGDGAGAEADVVI